ncbi:hypothetical protein [Rickettsiella endosymbiont of Miltochrista miniata]|uniref:hypothetical protein n=1 Tax=Rickettsiella endosymbiont of Miltochrista miniata TaxID=3066239 RepID=UPI00313C6725
MTAITNNKITPGLLNNLKELKLHSSGLIGKLPELIDEKKLEKCQLLPNQLKAILFLFPKLDRFNAFKLLVKHFDIKLSSLSESEIKELSVCLSQDPAFNNLLPFAKKNFGGIFLAKKNEEKLISPLIQKETKGVINAACIHHTKSRPSSKQSQAKVTNGKLSLAQLRLSLIQKCPELRLNFFKRNVQEYGYQAIIASLNIEEFKNIIELFPPNDAIKFLNFPMIRDRIDGFHRQNGQLSKESYIDLLNYFKPYQKESVKKLLRPIGPNIDTKLVDRGIFKEKIIVKPEHTKRLPDIVASHNMSRTR